MLILYTSVGGSHSLLYKIEDISETDTSPSKEETGGEGGGGGGREMEKKLERQQTNN
jgi:hypothetical protein